MRVPHEGWRGGILSSEMDGVLSDYNLKRSNGKKDATMQMAEARQKRTLRKAAMTKRAAEKKKKGSRSQSLQADAINRLPQPGNAIIRDCIKRPSCLRDGGGRRMNVGIG